MSAKNPGSASLLALTLALAGCGDDMVSTGAGTTTGASAASTSAGTSDASTSDASTSDASTSASASASASTSTSTSTSAGESEGSTSGGSTTVSDTTGVVEDAAYAAHYVAGGLDRIFLRKAEKSADLCTQVVLVWPGQGGDDALMIATPPEWGVESASIAQGVAGCLELESLLPPTQAAASGAGTVSWEGQGCPPTLDVDVTLDFIAGDLPWVPVKDQLSAPGLPVMGCP